MSCSRSALSAFSALRKLCVDFMTAGQVYISSSSVYKDTVLPDEIALRSNLFFTPSG